MYSIQTFFSALYKYEKHTQNSFARLHAFTARTTNNIFSFFYFFNICTRDISSRLSPSPYDFPYISPVHIQTWLLSKTAPESTRLPPSHKKHVETNERDNTLAEHTFRVTHRRTNSWKSSSARRLPTNK